MEPYLGMYVHMHWGYNNPYSARTWTLDNWRSYASGIKALGFNLIMFWPVLDMIPDPPTKSDFAHLEKMQKVIDMLHSEFEMDVLFTLGPNVMGNARAAEFSFEDRPYFQSDLRLNPADPDVVDKLINFRRGLFRYLSKADGCVIIDSDPGGYIGSTNDEFTDLFLRHIELIKEFNESAQVYYWMWCGWETYNKMWELVRKKKGCFKFDYTVDDYDAVIKKLMEHPEQPWRVFSCWPLHQEIVEKYGIEDRTLFLPYGLIEGEPSFPLTNYNPEKMTKGFSRYDKQNMQLGVMANAQTHIVQLPQTYLFSHFAKGGGIGEVDLPAFAEELIPGFGLLLANSWIALQSSDFEEMRNLSLQLRENQLNLSKKGKYSGLLLQTPQDFLKDVAMQLDFRADLIDFLNVLNSDSDWLPCLKALVKSWSVWQKQTGFADACGEINGLFEAFHKLNNPAVDKALDDIESWNDPSLRNGALARLIQALKVICEA